MNSQKSQKGAVLLVTVLVLSTITTSVLMLAHSTMTKSQQINSNYAAAEIVHGISQSALELAMVDTTTSMVTTQPDGDVVPIRNLQITPGYEYEVVVVQHPTIPSVVTFKSRGYILPSTNHTVTISQMATKTPIVRSTDAPLNARLTVDVPGELTVTSQPGIPLIWSGDVIDVPQIQSTIDGEQFTVYQSDDSLQTVSVPKFFDVFFTRDKSYIKSISDVISCPTTCSLIDIPTTQNIVWIDGDIEIDTGTFGADVPMILISTGSVTFTGSYTEFTGLIYANGIYSSNMHTISITGRLISESVIELNGPLSLTYDHTVTDDHCYYTKIPNTWTDIGD